MKNEVLAVLKKNWNWIALIAILILGLYLRSYHLDYPVIGYHNWKETHYLTEARNFAREGFFKHGFFIPEFDYPNLHGNPMGAHTDTFPIISIFIALGFKLFGIKLIVARTINLLFSLGSIIMIYLFVRQLSKREDFACMAALLTSINPLFVFFSHNTQLINPGLFFMLVSAYFYVKWLRQDKSRYLIFTSLFFVLATLTKYPFFIIAVPMLFTFPYKKLLKFKEKIKMYFYSASILFAIPGWLIYTILKESSINGYSALSDAATSLANFSLIFSFEFWKIIKFFFADNYTLFGVFFAFLGLIFVFLFAKKKTVIYKFIIGFFIGAVLFFFLGAEKLKGHNYHQFPIAPLFIILIAYSFLVVSNTLAKLIKIKYLKFITSLILFLLLLNTSIEAKDRMFDTQFYGLDIAGNYIKEHSQPNERLFFSGHQSYGVLWHADRKGYDIKIPRPEDFEYAEKNNLNITWVFIYQWGFELFNHKKEWNYIANRFSLKQIAFLKTSQGNQLIYLLLGKGGAFNLTELSSMLENKSVFHKIYETTSGPIRIDYVNLE